MTSGVLVVCHQTIPFEQLGPPKTSYPKQKDAPVHFPSRKVKKAYRNLARKEHPDKAGRGQGHCSLPGLSLKFPTGQGSLGQIRWVGSQSWDRSNDMVLQTCSLELGSKPEGPGEWVEQLRAWRLSGHSLCIALLLTFLVPWFWSPFLLLLTQLPMFAVVISPTAWFLVPWRQAGIGNKKRFQAIQQAYSSILKQRPARWVAQILGKVTLVKGAKQDPPAKGPQSKALKVGWLPSHQVRGFSWNSPITFLGAFGDM